jgi:putative transposase
LTYYERNLPHWHPEDAAIFLTWNLHGAMPKKPDIILPPGKRFAAIDHQLHAAATGPKWLNDERVARCVTDAFECGERELQLYELVAWVLVCNHVHLLIWPKAPLAGITKSVKNYSALRANAVLERRGSPFWQRESFDRWVRDRREFACVVAYIENNPVQARIVERPEEYRWSSAYHRQ